MLANKGPRVVIPRGLKAIALCATNRDIVQRIVETVKHKRKAAQANITEVKKLYENAYNISFSAVVSEVNLVGNTKEWWVDTGATRHKCSDKKMFSS